MDGTSFMSYRSALKLQCYAVRHYTAVARLNQTRSILSLSIVYTTGSFRHKIGYVKFGHAYSLSILFSPKIYKSDLEVAYYFEFF